MSVSLYKLGQCGAPTLYAHSDVATVVMVLTVAGMATAGFMAPTTSSPCGFAIPGTLRILARAMCFPVSGTSAQIAAVAPERNQH